ncbi:MAG TPA: NF038122 family metalloprotease, partial [Pyrinomonadaceae bacterium]|nr:NF038122 family metalloprotease [Pyrinomonadaceae bacterium]
MISDYRRVFVLGVVAVLLGGTAIASRSFVVVSAAGNADGARLLKAERRRSSPAAGYAAQSPAETQATPGLTKSARREFTVYRDDSGAFACREATAEEIRERQAADPQKLGLRQINHLGLDKSAGAPAPEGTNLIIVLRATQQLQQNAAATAAFNRAAQNWESVIMSPITIYIDVDYGATNFGQQWPANVLGATGSPSTNFGYPTVRTLLNAEATGEGNGTKQAIFNALPTGVIPTDLGNADSVDLSSSIARAIGLLPATAQPSDDAAQIAFNSANTFDFDPSDGITAGAIDFDAVATHEIGHALGFDSDGGQTAAQSAPQATVWDFYRFRTGTTASTFSTAQRILTIGGSPDPLQVDFIPGNPELGLSTGGLNGSRNNGGDGWQSSHWRHVSTCDGYIGIMDPAISNGCRRTITSNDTLALTSFGYNLSNNNPPPLPTPPANDNFANAQTISNCSGSVNGSTIGATSEAGEPNHDPGDSTALTPNHSIWYRWQAPSSASATITTAGSDFDTIMAVYTGTALSTLSLLKFNDDVQDGVIRTSSVNFAATAGTVYWIAVDGWGGDKGTVTLN